MLVPKRPLWLREEMLRRRQNHLRAVVTQTEDALSYALQTLPEQRIDAIQRIDNIQLELDRLADLRYANSNPRT